MIGGKKIRQLLYLSYLLLSLGESPFLYLAVEADLGDLTGLVPDPCGKVTITVS